MYMVLHGRVALGLVDREVEAKQVAEAHHQRPDLWREFSKQMSDGKVDHIVRAEELLLQITMRWSWRDGVLSAPGTNNKWYTIWPVN